MDSIFEVIIPLVIAAVYFFSNILSKKSDDDGAPTPTARRIQDEIRRRSAELRQHAEDGEEEGSAPQTEETRSQGEPGQKLASRLEQHAGTRQAPARPMPPEPGTGGLTWESSADTFEQDMQASLQQIEATKIRAEALGKQAEVVRKNMGASGQQRRRSAGLRFDGPVRSTLNDPAAARVAFIYSEVLGAPISLKRGESIPGLNR